MADMIFLYVYMNVDIFVAYGSFPMDPIPFPKPIGE